MAGLTEPLQFRAFMRSAPAAGFDAVPFLDALLTIIFLAVNTSLFVFAPGTAVELPQTEVAGGRLDGRVAVLTVGRNGLYFFDGQKVGENTLEERLRGYAASAGIAGKRGDGVAEILLIKADRAIAGGELFGLMDVARAAGFKRIHLAAEPGPAAAAGGRSSDWEGGGF